MSAEYLITVIIPVYNLQTYLQECLDSIVAQSLGMHQLQVVLVNDGSYDASEKICLDFKKRYPDNVVYIKQENSGVSIARNKGIEHAKGQLTTFLDGDDKWSSASFEIAYNAYVSHPDISIFSCRMEFFDAEIGPHQLNYKYKTDRIIDINENYNYPQMSASSVFITTDLVRRFRFATGIKYSEDFRYMSELLMDVGKYMVLEKPVYMYRRRAYEISAMQQSVKDPEYYIPTCNNVYKYLFDSSIKKHGYVLRYLQYCVMYDLRSRLKIPLKDTPLDEDASIRYCALIQDLLIQIDEDIILDQKRIVTALKLYAIALRNDTPALLDLFADDNGVIRYKDIPVFDFMQNRIIKICNVSASGESLQVSGIATIPFYDDCFTLSCLVNNTLIELPLKKTNENAKPYLHGVIRFDYSFELSVHINSSKRTCIRFEAVFNGESYVTRPVYKTGSGLDTKAGVTQIGNKLIYRDLESLIIVPVSIINRLTALARRILHFRSKHTAKD